METLNLGDSGLLPNQKTSICEFPDLITTCSARRWPSVQLPPIVRLRLEGVVAWASWWSRDASRCHFA